MEFGMFHEFQALPGETAAQSFTNSLAQVDAAERWGLDAMWLAELHFAPERSVLSSPMMIAATIAQRTERMRARSPVGRVAPRPDSSSTRQNSSTSRRGSQA